MDERELRSLRPQAVVSLYELDLLPINIDQQFRFVDSVLGGQVIFDSQTYVPWSIEVDGLKLATSGPLPEPSVQVFNYENTIIELLDLYDPRGALFTHRTVPRENLDDGTNPDPTQQFEAEIYKAHAYKMADICVLRLVSSLAELKQDYPRFTVAMARDAD